MRRETPTTRICWAAGLLASVLRLHAADLQCRTNPFVPGDFAAEFHTRSWTTEDGLPQNTVLCILQTTDGYLWSGTLDGLARFDGLRFAVFDQQNTPAFRNHAVLALAERPAGCLWIGTRGGLLQYSNHVFTRVPLGEQEVPVRSICASQIGGVWLGTDRGLMHVDRGHVVCYTNYPGYSTWDPAQGAQCRAVKCVAEDTNGSLWAADDRGVVRLRPSAKEFEVVYEFNPGWGTRGWGNVRTVIADDRGGVWFGNELGLFHFSNEKLEHYPREANGFPRGPTPLTWKGQELWIAGAPGAAARWGSDRFVHFRLPGLLAGDALNCVSTDREGNLWLGTQKRGVTLMRTRRLLTLTTADGLAGDDAWSICEAPDRSVWIATDGGLCHYTPDGRFTTNLVAPPPSRFNGFGRVLVARSGTVWTGCSLGLCKIEGQKVVPVLAEIGTNGFRLPVQSLYEDPAGALWVGSGNLYRLKEGKWDCWGPRGGGETNQVLPNASVLSVLQDAIGDVWVGTKRGICRFHGLQCECFTRSNGFPADIAGPAQADADGTVWFCSSEGLIRFKNKRFFLISTQHGLHEDPVYNVLEDEFGWLWLNGNRGLQRVRKLDANDLADGKIQRVPCLRYGLADGMLSAEGNGDGSPNSCRTRDGRLWFPTTKGVVMVDPRALTNNETPPPVVIEQVVADRQVVFGDSCQPKAEGAKPKLSDRSRLDTRLEAGRARSLLIRYTANSFASPEQVRFAYKLEGHDQTWNEDSSNLRTAIYTDLRPGTYRFRVKALSSHGAPSVQDAQFAFSLAPYFHQTWPFYALCACGTLAFGWSLHWLRMRALRRIQELEQLHALDVERARIARDMHDSLAADLTRIAMLADMAQRQSSQGTNQAQWSKAGDLARGLVDGIGELIWATNPRNNSLDALASYLRGYASEFVAAAGLRCRLDFPDEVPPLPISGEARRHLFLSAKEALTNVVKHARASRIVLRFSLAEGQVTISVDDDGCGFTFHQTPAVEGPSDTPRWSGGNGLRNLQERLGAIGGQCVIQSREGSGTHIRMTAPLDSVLYQ